jgi:Protein of unknown function (DUF3662)/FHA domain
VFRSAVQPVELAAALQREVDNSAQILSRERRLVPNDFTIELSPSDSERLSPYGGQLTSELKELLRQHADQQRYVFAGPVNITFEVSEDLGTGRFRVASRAMAKVTPVEGQRLTDTAVRRAPVVLELNGMKHPLEPPGVVIGRGSEADLRVSDPGVSRRHAEIRVRPAEDGVVVTVVDLGSTNGTRVNGKRVQHATLDDGAEIEIGSTTIVLHSPRGEGHGDRDGPRTEAARRESAETAQSPRMDEARRSSQPRPDPQRPSPRPPSSDWPR